MSPVPGTLTNSLRVWSIPSDVAIQDGTLVELEYTKYTNPEFTSIYHLAFVIVGNFTSVTFSTASVFNKQ